MTRFQRLVFVVVIAVPVLLMSAFGLLHLKGEVFRVLESSQWLVADEVSRQIGRDVRIGKAALTPLGRLVLEDVAVAQGASFSEGRLAIARRVAVRYDYAAILFQGAGASGVSSVEVLEPQVWLVRYKDGSLNIADLLKPAEGPARPPFAGTLDIVDAEIFFGDFRAPRGGVPRVTVLRQTAISLDAREARKFRFEFSAKGSPGSFTTILAAGVYDARREELLVDARADRLGAAFASSLLGLTGGTGAWDGSADLRVSASLRLGDSPGISSIAGLARLGGVSAFLPPLGEPVRGVSGTVVFGGESAVLDLSGGFAGARVAVRGTVVGLASPKLDLAATARDVGLKRFSRATGLPLDAAGITIPRASVASAFVTGTTAEPRVEIAASAPEGYFRGYRFRDVNADLIYAQNRLSVRSADIRFHGARVQLSGSIGTAGRIPIDLHGRVRGLSLDAVPIPTDYPVSGSADVDLSITGTASDPTASLEAVAADVRMMGRTVESVEAAAEVSRRGVVLHRLNALGVAGGTFTAEGVYESGEIDLNVKASGVQLDSLGSLVHAPWIGGVAYLTGSLSGTLQDPFLRAYVEVYKPRYGDYTADYARASIGADKQSVTVASGDIMLFPAEMHLSGKVSGIGGEQIVFQTEGRMDRLNLEQVFDTVGRRLDMSGTIGGDFTASGVYDLLAGDKGHSLTDTFASGHIRLTDGAALGYPVEDAVGQVTFRDNVLTLSEMVISSEGAGLTLGGSVFVDNTELDLDFSVKDFDLARASSYLSPYVVATGNADAQGTVSGPWKAPVVEVKGELHDLVANRMKFDKTTASARYSGDVVSSGQVQLVRGAQEYDFRVTGLDLPQKHLASGEVQITNANLVELWNALRYSPLLRTERARKATETVARIPSPSAGLLNVTASVSGSLTTPDGVLSLQGKDIGLDIHRIESLDLAATAEDGVVTLRQLRATSGDAYVNASGSPLYDKGSVQLALSLGNLELDRFNYRLGDNTIKGALNVELEAAGKASSPTVTLSAEVLNPTVNGFAFDRLRASRIDVGGGRISFPDPDSGIILAVGSHQLLGYGFLPWDWSSLTVPRDQPLELNADMSREDLSIFSSFASLVDGENTKGPLNATLSLGGTLDAPELDGRLRVEDGTLALDGFTNVFQNVNVDLSFDGNRVQVGELSASSSLGGKIGVQPGGTVAVTGSDKAVDLVLISDGLKVMERNVLGTDELVSMRLDAGLAVTGDLASPLVSDADKQGKDLGRIPPGILVSDALVRFAIPEKQSPPGTLTLPLSPEFDVGLRIGQNVRLQPPSLDLTVSGGGRLKGSLTDPARPLNLAVDIVAEKGSLYLATTRLTVSPESAISVSYSPPAEPKVTLRKFKATTSVAAKNELGNPQRYQISVEAAGPVTNMQFSMNSDPPGLSRQQILMALGRVEGLFGPDEHGLQEDIASAVTAVGSSALFRPLERVFTEQLGFEQFSLEYSNVSPLSLFLSTKLADNLRFSYYRRLQSSITQQSQAAYQARISWRFRRNYDLSFGIDDEQVVTGQIDFTKAFR